MNYKIFSPSKELKSIVKQYVVFNSLDNIDNLLFLPNGGSFIIFNRGINAETKLFGIDKMYRIPITYSTSFKTNRVKQIFLDLQYKHNPEMFPIIMVELLPIGFYKLFNKEMRLKSFGYQEIKKEIVNKYFSKIYTNGDINEELDLLDNSLVELNNSQNNSHLPIEDIIEKIYNDYYLDVTVKDILKDFGYSRSTLERHFKKMIGLTPKQFIYITKFCNTLLEYIDEKRTFNELQYIYSDNSHMNAVFQKFLGIAPSEIFKKVVDGEIAIYQLLNLKLNKYKNTKRGEMKSHSDILKYSKKISVLYVEDDDILRDVMMELLKNYFDNLDVAKDGKSGLDMYSENHNSGTIYDLVITDINMPKMNGIEMSKNILNIVPSQIIIIISAHCEYMNSAESLGINNILFKPLNNEEFSNKIFEVSKEIYNNKSL